MTININHIDRRLLYTSETATDIRAALIEAIAINADLRGADLRGAWRVVSAATAPIICPGSNQFVESDQVHSRSRARCPSCGRWTKAHVVPDSRFLSVQAHCPLVHPDLGIHGPGCDAVTTGECTCAGTHGYEDLEDGHWTDRWDTPAEREGLR